MDISLSLLQENDAEEVFEFEKVNRIFFEKMMPGRGEDYYQWEIFLERHRELLEEQERGVCRFYLIKDPDGNIAGRINLVDIDAAAGTAEVGFRLEENYGGKGIGSNALSFLLSTESNLKQIHAKTTTVNKSSQRVLEKNGLIHMGISGDEFEMNGKKMRFVRYLWVSN